jgi:DNA-binding FadR family transcriptional regulator
MPEELSTSATPGELALSGRSLDEATELYEMRVTLEPLATGFAARQLSSDELAALEWIVAEMRGAEPARFVELNREFHGRIYPAARRERLGDIIEEFREPAARYVRMNIDLYDPAYRDQVQSEHEAILAALRSRAPSWAAHAMRVHLEHSARQVARLIERSREQASKDD